MKKNPFTAIITFSILVALALVIIIGFKAVSLNLSFFGQKQTNSSQDQKSISPKSQDEIEITINEQDIQTIIADKAGTYLSNPTVSITKSAITTTGKTSIMGINTDAKISLLPKVDNGKLSFDITEAKAGIINIPATITGKITPIISDYLNVNINNRGTVSNFILEDKKIIIRIKGA